MVEVLIVVVLALALALYAWSRAFRRIYVMPGNVALIARGDGELQTFPAGLHRYFDPKGVIRPIHVKIGAQPLPAQQLEVISSDRFAFRVTVTPIIDVEDARLFAEAAQSTPGMPGIPGTTFAVSALPASLSPLLAQATTRALAEKTLEEFLDDPVGALDGIHHAAMPALPGAKVVEIALTAVTLPPELRKMFTEVERARREGLASLERARSEQASLRALANAARSLSGNPQLAQLRMLQVMESARGSKTFVLGQSEDFGSPSGTAKSKE